MKTIKIKKKPITWYELTNFYHKKTGGQARIKPMDSIFNWALLQKKDIFYKKKEGTLHFIVK